jgi:RNA 2',3'-cyclic 3'-phosphodiesterase
MQAALADATRSAVAACHGNAIPARNYHFTLAFLGDVPESRTAQLNDSALRIAPSAPLTVTLDEIAYWRRSQLLCATSTVEAAEATALAEALGRALVADGFTPDLERKFRPHITLARKARSRVPSTRILPLTWTFHEFVLVASQLMPQGSVYSIISRYPRP